MPANDTTYNLVERLRSAAEKVANERVADLLEEAAWRIETLESYIGEA